MDTYNQSIQQIYSSLGVGFAVILVFVFLRRITNYVLSLPPSHPIPTGGRMLWGFFKLQHCRANSRVYAHGDNAQGITKQDASADMP